MSPTGFLCSNAQTIQMLTERKKLCLNLWNKKDNNWNYFFFLAPVFWTVQGPGVGAGCGRPPNTFPFLCPLSCTKKNLIYNIEKMPVSDVNWPSYLLQDAVSCDTLFICNLIYFPCQNRQNGIKMQDYRCFQTSNIKIQNFLGRRLTTGIWSF